LHCDPSDAAMAAYHQMAEVPQDDEEDPPPPSFSQIQSANTQALIAGVLGVIAMVVLLVAFFIPSWVGFGGIDYSSQDDPLCILKKDPQNCDNYKIQFSVSMSMVFASATFGLPYDAPSPSPPTALPDRLYPPNQTLDYDQGPSSWCGIFPTTRQLGYNSNLTGWDKYVNVYRIQDGEQSNSSFTNLNHMLMDMCKCKALCRPGTPLQASGDLSFFCDQDKMFQDVVYPLYGSMGIFMLCLIQGGYGAVLLLLASRPSSLELQMKCGCCRLSQAGFSCYCACCCFIVLGAVFFLAQVGWSIDVCGGAISDYGQTVSLGIGWGFLLVLLSLLVMGFGCHFAKQARDVHEDIPAPGKGDDSSEMGAVKAIPAAPVAPSAGSSRPARPAGGWTPPAAGPQGQTQSQNSTAHHPYQTAAPPTKSGAPKRPGAVPTKPSGGVQWS